MLTTLWYLSHSCHWEPKERESGDYLIGLCPIHQERHPSFRVHIRTGRWDCYHEGGLTGDVIGLINQIEFGGVNVPHIWAQCYERAQELSGGNWPASSKRNPQPRAEPPRATEEQQEVMTAAMYWWHELLYDPQEGKRGRDYFLYRGVQLKELHETIQLGYAPKLHTGNTTKLTQGFAARMRSAIGTDWQKPAMQLGLLFPSGDIATRNRVMFSSIDGQLSHFFHGRMALFPDEEDQYKIWLAAHGKTYYKSMSARGIAKVPFELPVTHRRIPGTLHVEAPWGPAVLAPYGVKALGWYGGTMPTVKQLLHLDSPHWLGQDNDSAHYRKDGSVYYPGEEQAKRFMQVLDEIQRPYERILPPTVQIKDIDKWYVQEGIRPLLTLFEASPLLSSSSQEEEALLCF